MKFPLGFRLEQGRSIFPTTFSFFFLFGTQSVHTCISSQIDRVNSPNFFMYDERISGCICGLSIEIHSAPALPQGTAEMIVAECLWLPSEQHHGLYVHMDVKHSSCSYFLRSKKPHSLQIQDGFSSTEHQNKTRVLVPHKGHQKLGFKGGFRDRKGTATARTDLEEVTDRRREHLTAEEFIAR